jgi:hypothetical protein
MPGILTTVANLGRVSTTTDEKLEAANWDLEPLVNGAGPDGVEAMLSEARDRAHGFAERYRGRVGELEPPSTISRAGPATTRC